MKRMVRQRKDWGRGMPQQFSSSTQQAMHGQACYPPAQPRVLNEATSTPLVHEEWDAQVVGRPVPRAENRKG